MLFLFRPARPSHFAIFIFHYAWVGALLSFGIAAQPDVMLLFAHLVVLYGLFRCIVIFRDKNTNKKIFIFGTLKGLACSAMIFLLLGISLHEHLFKTVITARQKQQGATPAQKWEFATNWSFPPEEMIEFIAPCIFGTETFDPQTAYWGTYGSETQPASPLLGKTRTNAKLGTKPAGINEPQTARRLFGRDPHSICLL